MLIELVSFLAKSFFNFNGVEAVRTYCSKSAGREDFGRVADAYLL